MLRYIAFGITLTGLIIGTQLYLAQPKSEATPVPAPQVVESVNTATTNQSKLTASPSSNPINSRESTSSTFNQDDNQANNQALPTLESTSSNEAWQEDLDPPIPPSRYTNKGIDARPLKIAKQQFTSIGVGDKLKLPIPQTSQSYEMSIAQVGRHRNGDKTLKGHLTNQPEYAVVVTEGQNSTYATINTPDGSFMLEAKQDQGWLVAANDLDVLSDPNLSDYQIPDINRNLN